jgi:hypothetical protein
VIGTLFAGDVLNGAVLVYEDPAYVPAVLFGLVGDIVGGAAGGFLIALGARTLVPAGEVQSSGPRTNVRLASNWLKAHRIHAVGAVVLLLGSYFLFIYRLPTHVTFTFQDWKGMALVYAPITSALYASDSREDIVVPLEASQVLAHSYVERLELDVELDGEADGQMMVFIGTVGDASKDKQTDFRQVFRKSTPVGRIVVTGGHINTSLQVLRAQDEKLSLLLPRQTRVRLSKDPRDFRALVKGRLLLGPADSDRSLLVAVEGKGGARMRLEKTGELSIYPNTPWIRFRWASRRVDWMITIPGELQVIRIPAEEELEAKSGFWGPFIGMTIGGGDRKHRFQFGPSMDQIELAGGVYYFGSEETPAVVSEIVVSGASGELRVGDVSKQVGRGDLVSISQAVLEMQGRGSQGIVVQGTGRHISVNGEPLSRTVWGLIAVQIQASIIGAFVATAFAWWFVYRRSR